MSNSSNVKKYLHHWEEGFSGLVIFLVVPVIVLLGAMFYFYKPTYIKDSSLVTSQVAVVPTPSPWKTYTNSQYGFEITYPSKGVVLSKSGMQAGGCGNAIKADAKNASVETLLIDNFFSVKILDWDKPISAYVKKEGAVGKYNIKVFNGSGADEAIVLEGLKKNVEYARGFPPLAYVSSLYKKDDKLFIVQNFQNPQNQGGCVPPEIANPSDYPEIAKQKWNMATSLKFNSSESQIANIASANCTEKGGTLTIGKRGDGGEYGICNFEGNKQCEEWALLQGDCSVGGVKVSGYDTPQQVYCVITGGSTTVEPGALCKYKDSSSCDLDDLYVGRCQKGI